MDKYLRLFPIQKTKKSDLQEMLYIQRKEFYGSFFRVSVWFPILMALGLGVILARFIVSQNLLFGLALALAVPSAVLFINRPFWAVLIWLVLLPFVMNDPSSAGRYILWFLHRALIPSTLALMIFSNAFVKKQKVPVRLGWAEYSLLIFCGLLFFNIIVFSETQTQQLIQAYDEVIIPICMYVLIRVLSPSEKEIKLLFGIALFIVITQSTIGIMSQFVPQILPSRWSEFAGARTVGTLENPAVYTSVLMFGALLIIHFVIHTESRRLKFALLVIFSLAIYSIFLSFSRGSWLGAVIVLFILTVTYSRIMVRLMMILGIVVLILGSTVLSTQLVRSYERMTSDEAFSSAESRITANDASIRMIISKPFLGWGYGNYDEIKKTFVRRVGNVPIHDATSHNSYLTVGAELGLVTLVLYMFPLIWWLIQSKKIWGQLPESGIWSKSFLLLMWLAILNFLVVTNFMDMFRYFPFGTTLWWLILGLIASFVTSIQKDEEYHYA
jgi:O-antigen ligase